MSPHQSNDQRDLRSTLIVGLLTVCSRVAGLAREAVLALFLGTRVEADAFRVAFLLPNLLRRLVGEGAATSAFVAVYSRHARSEGDEGGVDFAERFLTLWICGLAIIALAGAYFMSDLFHVIRPALGDGKLTEPANFALTIDVSRIVFGYVFFIGGVAAAQGILNARRIFGAPAFVPALFNVVVVAAACILATLFAPGRAVFAIAYAILIGGAFQLAWLIPPLWRIGVRFKLRSPFGHAGVSDVLRLMVPGIIGAGVYQLSVVLSTLIAGRLPHTGSIASLAYSNRFMEFVLGVFVVALSTVSLTSLARFAAAGDEELFATRALEMVRLILFVTIPSTAGLFVIHSPLISLVLEQGEFGDTSLAMTVAAFRCHLPGLVAIGVSRALVAGFHARKNLRTPVVVAAWILPFNLALAYVLSLGPLRHAGIALAASVAAWVQCATLLSLFYREVPRLRLTGLPRFLALTIVVSAVMGAICQLSAAAIPLPEGKILRAAWILIVVGIGVVSFFGLATLCRLPESRALLGLFRRSRHVD